MSDQSDSDVQLRAAAQELVSQAANTAGIAISSDVAGGVVDQLVAALRLGATIGDTPAENGPVFRS